MRTFRLSTNILGDGYVEMMPDQEILDSARSRGSGAWRGSPWSSRSRCDGWTWGEDKPRFRFVERIGRFGWKCQQASLLGFAADAYLNEMGITSPIQPTELTSLGRTCRASTRSPTPRTRTRRTTR